MATVKELRKVAKAFGINLKGARRKADVVSAVRKGLDYSDLVKTAKRSRVSAGGRKEDVAVRLLDQSNPDNWTASRVKEYARDIGFDGPVSSSTKRTILSGISRRRATAPADSRPLKSQIRTSGNSIVAAVLGTYSKLDDIPNLNRATITVASVVASGFNIPIPFEVIEGGADEIELYVTGWLADRDVDASSVSNWTFDIWEMGDRPVSPGIKSRV